MAHRGPFPELDSDPPPKLQGGSIGRRLTGYRETADAQVRVTSAGLLSK